MNYMSDVWWEAENILGMLSEDNKHRYFNNPKHQLKVEKSHRLPEKSTHKVWQNYQAIPRVAPALLFPFSSRSNSKKVIKQIFDEKYKHDK